MRLSHFRGRRMLYRLARTVFISAMVVAVSPLAHAYVRTRAASSSVALRWRKPCVAMQLIHASAVGTVSTELFNSAANAAASAWSRPNLGCTDLSLAALASSFSDIFVDADRINSVQFLQGFWGRRAAKSSDRVPYPSSALAITSVFANRATGEIIDADVEINSIDYQWADLVLNPAAAPNTKLYDLQNTLTHEFGHLIGLDHSCDPGGQPDLVDNSGKPVLPCPGPPEVQDSTMSGTIEPHDTKRRTLSADDILAVCEIYPAQGAPECGNVSVDAGLGTAGGTSGQADAAGTVNVPDGGAAGMNGSAQGGGAGAGGSGGSGGVGEADPSGGSDGGCSLSPSAQAHPSLLAFALGCLGVFRALRKRRAFGK